MGKEGALVAEIVVVGAGPAGLMAALGSARSGHRCTLLEAGPAVGGMAGSFEVAGQRVDYGSHRLHPATPEPFLELFRSLLGSDLQVRPRNGRIRLRGRWLGFPLRAGDMLRSLPPSFTLRAGLDTLAAPLRRRAGDGSASFESEIVRRFGPTVAREFYVPYSSKLYGVEACRLDRELARRRVSASGAGDVLRRVARAARPQGRTFLYPRRGYGQLSEALAEAAADAGAELRLRTPVVGLRAAADGVEVRSDRGVVQADLVLSTMPLPALALALGPPQSHQAADTPADGSSSDERGSPGLVVTPEAADALADGGSSDERGSPGLVVTPEAADALARCRSRAMVLAYLVVDRPRFTSFDAHYFPGPETVVSRLSEPKNYRDGDDPPDRTVLCAEIPCWPGEELWRCDDDRISQIVVEGLGRAGLAVPEPAAVEVRRLPSVYPVYESATKDARATVGAWIRDLARNGVVTLGRQGLGVLDNLHHVLAMGDAAANAVRADGVLDDLAWDRSLEGFAGHVVED